MTISTISSKSSYSHFLIILIALAISSCFCNAYAHHHHHHHHLAQELNIYKDSDNVSDQAMFVFGDSVYDIGNAQIYDPDVYNPPNHHPYGFAYFPTPTGRASDGLLIPDIVGMMGGAHVAVPYLLGDVPFTYGANFAFQGAAVLTQDSPGGLNLGDQLDEFYTVVSNWTSEFGAEKATEKLNKAVILFQLGGVDYLMFSNDSPNATLAQQQQFVTLIIDTLVTAIKEMYDVGARKFAFQNIAALGCSPRSRVIDDVILSGDCTEFLITKMAKLHNTALSNATQVLEAQLSDFKYGIFDFYTAQLDMIRNPTHYGFTEGETACCGSGLLNYGDCGEEPYMVCTNPSAYVFFDNAHNSQRANLILSQVFWEGSSQTNNATTMEPYSLKELFNGSSSSSSKLMMHGMVIHATI